VTRRLGKNLPNFSKNSPNSSQVQENYISAQFESPNHLPQTSFETLKYLQQTMRRNCFLGENEK
jgi:hypothetical protein